MPTRVEGLTVVPFGAHRPTLNAVSFSLAESERVLLVGPSGAGKSTLLLALTGVLQNLETAQVTGQIDIPDRGLLLQNYSDATIADSVARDVAFGAESAGIRIANLDNLVSTALYQVGLEGLDQDRNPATLSGGELQRVCLAGLIAMKPRILLLDEPTSQLDEEAASQVRAAVHQYLADSGAAAIIVEHQFSQWLPVVNRVLILNSDGELAFDGPWDQALSQAGDSIKSWGLWDGTEPNLIALGNWEAELGFAGQGRITALVGHSGAGKSTRLKARLQAQLQAGTANFGWLPQNPGLALNEPSVALCLAARKVSDSAEALADLGLAAHLNQGPHELSGGEQRRLGLLLALGNGASEVYLDEPTVGLDRHNWAAVVKQILAARARGVQLTIATHDPLLLKFADSIEQVLAPLSSASPAPRQARAYRRHLPFSPLGLLAASFAVLVGALNSSNLVGLLVALAVETCGILVLSGFYGSLRRPRLLVPILIGALSVGFSNWWLSTSHAFVPAAIVAARVLVFGLPGLLFAAAVAPSALGDQLGQTLRLPARPVVAAMVGLNRVHQLARNWENLALVRQVHGVANRNRVRELLVLTTQSLVAATKGAETASVAMESRGFSLRGNDGSYIKRSWAVPARWLPGDIWLFLTGVAIAAVAVAVRF